MLITKPTLDRLNFVMRFTNKKMKIILKKSCFDDDNVPQQLPLIEHRYFQDFADYPQVSKTSKFNLYLC